MPAGSGQSRFDWLGWIDQAKLTPHEPVHDASLSRAESALGEFPADLRAFLKVSNGLSARYDVLVWSADEIVRQNAEFRSMETFRELYMPFDHLLFFGEAGDGDLFAYPIKHGTIGDGLNLYRWEHENDSRTWVASGLLDYLNRRLNDTI